MGLTVGDPYASAACLGFSSTDQSLDPQYLIAIDLAWRFFLQGLHDLVVEFHTVFLVQPKNFIEVFYKIGKADRILIKYRYVTRSLIGNMHFMTLVDQPDKRTPHGNDIVIGMGTEYDSAFGKGLRALRTMGVIRIRLAPGPSRDGVLELIEYFYVHLVGRAKLRNDVAHAMFHVVVVRELQHGLTDCLTKPNHGTAN